MRSWQHLPRTARDAVGAVPIVLVFVIAQQLYGPGGSAGRAAAIVIVMGAALTVRRRWPRATFGAALLMVAIAATGLEFLVIASYTLLAHDERVRPWVVSLVAAAAMTLGFLQYWPALVLEEMAGDLILVLAIAVIPVAVGQGVRRARATTAELRQRNAELVVLREQAAQHAVEAERFRIARELHDVVAHHVSAMTVRARAGRHVADRDPEAAAEALAYVADAGTEALTAMGTFVGALRGEGSVADVGDRSPQPGVEDISALLESYRRAGLVVHDERVDLEIDVGPALGLNLYRITQEALTNAMRHGAADRAWVRLWRDGAGVRLRVDDDGRGLRAGHRPGHGLVGIAERAALHGGTSELARSPRGGCRLEARLPLGPSGAVEVTAAPAVRS